MEKCSVELGFFGFLLVLSFSWDIVIFSIIWEFFVGFFNLNVGVVFSEVVYLFGCCRLDVCSECNGVRV